MYDKRIFAKNLAYYMDKHKETQVDVSKLIGVSKSNVSAYLKADQIPRIDKVQILANHYGVCLSALLDNKKAAPEAPGAEKQLLEIFRQLDDEGQRLAIGMMKTLLTEHAQKNHTDSVNETAIGGAS